jgi:hypothetical protein
LFQIFGKLKKSNDYNSTGVGLGLAYCKNVISKLNGEIFCDSEKGKGAKFTFFIKAESCDEGLSKNEQEIFNKNLEIMFQYIHDIINNIVLEQSLNDKNLNSVFNKMISKQIM